MNWGVFIILAWFALGLDLGLAPALAPGAGEVRPSFLFPLIVFVALRAPARTALWAGLIGGLMIDLTTPLARNGAPLATVPGPNALGTLIAAQLVLSTRAMVMHRNPLTMAVLTVAGAIVAGIAVVAVFTLRGFFGDSIIYESTHELGIALGCALYTGAAALLMSLPLFWLAPVFGFAGQGSHAQGGRFTWSHSGRG
ncbi:MAG: hypothetical protein DHS20C14_10140 [Phycisphaeraceae bacterium]|nr:MAG: hypothetical protein DHS20C14_10140 [Phycisphaeraceae bacterium]